MKPPQVLRERIFFNSVESLLGVLVSWATPYPWYVDLVIVFGIDMISYYTSKSALSDDAR